MTSYNGDLVLVGGFLDGGNKNIESVIFENEDGNWGIVGQMNVEDQYFGVNIASWKQSMVELNQYIYAFGGYHMYNDDLIVESNKVLRINRLVTEFKFVFVLFISSVSYGPYDIDHILWSILYGSDIIHIVWFV